MRITTTATLIALASLSLLDWAWTLAHLARGVQEANPMLALAFEHGGYALFSAIKLGVNGAALAILARFRGHRMTRRLAPIALLAYALVACVHIATECMIA